MNFIDSKTEVLTVTHEGEDYSVTYYKPPSVQTGVVDEAYPDWSISTPYAVNEYVIIPELKRIYKCAVANTGDFPADIRNGSWVSYGAVNSYKAFATDEDIGAQSLGTDALYEFNFSSSNAIAGIDLDFIQADVLLLKTDGIVYKSDYVPGTTYDANDATIFDNKLWISNVGANTGNQPDTSPTEWTQNTDRIFFDENILGSDIGCSNFAQYFYDPVVKRTRKILTGLEWLPESILRIKFTGASKIGTICLGREEDMGVSITGSSLSYQSTSTITTDAFTGFRTVKRYGKIRLLEVEIMYDTDQFASTSQKIERIMDKNIIWIPTKSDIFSEAISIGYMEEGELPMEVSDKTITTATIIGVSK